MPMFKVRIRVWVKMRCPTFSEVSDLLRGVRPSRRCPTVEICITTIASDKYKIMQNLRTSQDYTSHILTYFAAKLHYFTKFKMLCPTVLFCPVGERTIIGLSHYNHYYRHHKLSLVRSNHRFKLDVTFALS